VEIFARGSDRPGEKYLVGRRESIRHQKKPGRFLPRANRIILNFTKYVDIPENMGVSNSEGVFFNNVGIRFTSGGGGKSGEQLRM